MVYTFKPRGVCSRQITVEYDNNGIITDCRFVGGCSGNTQGLSALLKGMNVKEAISRLKGIDCGGRGTSCPDQLAIGLEKALAEQK